jgi:hypothetical protein
MSFVNSFSGFGCGRHVAAVVARRSRLLPVDDRKTVLLLEQLVEHLPEPEELPVVDADGQDPAGPQHRLHHLQARPHEPHPLGVASPVVRGDQGPQPRVVGVVLPAIVVAPVTTRVVRRIGENEVHLASLAVERRHCLQIVALDEKVLGLLELRAARVFPHRLQHPRPNPPGQSSGVCFARELDVDAPLVELLEQAQKLLTRKLLKRWSPCFPARGHYLETYATPPRERRSPDQSLPSRLRFSLLPIVGAAAVTHVIRP